MENEFKVGQELSFNVYGNEVKGKYICMLNERTVNIEVTYDDLEVTDIGCTANVNLSFLVDDYINKETPKHTQGKCFQESANVMTSGRLIANCIGNGSNVTEEDLANAKLISEAFNVANETGKTPRQLQEQANKLIGILKHLRSELQYEQGLNKISGKGRDWSKELQSLNKIIK